MSEHLTASLAEIVNSHTESGNSNLASAVASGDRAPDPTVNGKVVSEAKTAESTAPEPKSWVSRNLEAIARRFGREHLAKLAINRGNVSKTLTDVPKRMHLIANQSALVLELIDDFRTGAYRRIPWHSIAVLTAAVLYTVNPADVIPDAVPVLGALDDLALLAVATRLVRNDLKEYCRFKNYSVEEYFGPDNSRRARRKQSADLASAAT